MKEDALYKAIKWIVENKELLQSEIRRLLNERKGLK
jgi:hypothetical protein